MTERFKIEKKTVGFNALAAAGSKFINMFVVLWAQHELLTNLSPDEFSIYPLIAILVYFLPLITASFTSPTQRFVTAAFAKGNSNEITEVVSTILFVLMIPIAIIAIGGGMLLYWLDVAFEIKEENIDSGRVMFGIILCSTLIKLLLQPFCVAFYAQQRLVAFHGIALVGEIVRLFALVALFWALGPQVIWVIATDAVVTTLVAATLAFRSRQMMPEIRFVRSAVNLSRVREFMSFGMFDVGISFSRMMRTGLPIWLLNRYDTSVAVNTFHVGQSAFRQVQKAWIPMRGTLGPPMIGMATTGQEERLQRTFYKGGRIALWLTMLLCTPLIVFNSEIGLLYAGHEYPWVGPVMAILLLRYPLHLMNALLPQLARAYAVPDKVSIPMVACELTALAVMAVSVVGFNFSVVGVALCSLVVTAFFELFVLAPIGNKLMNGSMRRSIMESLVPGLMPALIAAVVMFVTQEIVHPVSFWGVGFSTIPGLLAYLITAWFCFQPDDQRDFTNIVSAIRTKLARFSSTKT